MIAAAMAVLPHGLAAPLLVVAVLVATFTRGPGASAERFLSWILMLPIGVTAIWIGAFDVFFPSTVAAYYARHGIFYGGQASIFEFGQGMAYLGLGVAAVIAFWRGFEFKAAVACAACILLVGQEVRYVQQILAAGNFGHGIIGLQTFGRLIWGWMLPLLVMIFFGLAVRERRRVTVMVP